MLLYFPRYFPLFMYMGAGQVLSSPHLLAEPSGTILGSPFPLFMYMGSASKCGDDNTCPAPMYINSGKYLGKYSNIDEVAPSNGDEDFGLDVYEPQFFASPGDWQEAGKYEVALKFDVTDFTKDIVYFCHIHQYMSGKIKWVDEDGDVLQEDDDPKIPYGYERATAYDQSCGTYGVADFKL